MTDHANSFINSAMQYHCMDSMHSLIYSRKTMQLHDLNRIAIILFQYVNEIGKLFHVKPSEH